MSPSSAQLISSSRIHNSPQDPDIVMKQANLRNMFVCCLPTQNFQAGVNDFFFFLLFVQERHFFFAKNEAKKVCVFFFNMIKKKLCRGKIVCRMVNFKLNYF